MAASDYVNAMKWYSQAIASAPKDATLYSNRSFAFLRLKLGPRALADAEEAIKLKPTWAKGYFRRAEALSLAGLHDDALRAYQTGASLDPEDTHLQAQCTAATQRVAQQKLRERMIVGLGCAIGFALIATLLFAGVNDEQPVVERGGGKTPPEPLLSKGVSSAIGLVFGALLGGLAGFATTKLQAHLRQGAALPPLQTNQQFVSMQMRHDQGGAGKLRKTAAAEVAARGSHSACTLLFACSQRAH